MTQTHARQAAWLSAALGLLAVLSLLCWWRIRLLGDPRLRFGEFLAYFALLLACYLAALWRIGRAQAAAVPSRACWNALALILVSAACSRALLVGASPVFSDDIYRYRWDGRVQLAGFDSYAYPPDHPALAPLRDPDFARINFPHLRTVYPPLTQQAFRLGAWWAPTVAGQKAVFLAAEALLIAGLLLMLRVRRRLLLWVAAYAWHPLAILEVAGSGHNDTLGVALLWSGVVAWELRWHLGAASAWTLAFLAKLGSLILVPWWSFRRKGAIGLGAFALAAAAALAWHPALLQAMADAAFAMHQRVESNASLYLALGAVFGYGGGALLAAGAAWVALLVWWGRRETDPVRYLLVAVGSAALLTPALHPWYLLWLIPCFCFWRVPALVALTGTVVLGYAVWPGYLQHGTWMLPRWARMLEYAPVVLLGCWEARTWWWQSLFRPAMKRVRSAKS